MRKRKPAAEEEIQDQAIPSGPRDPWVIVLAGQRKTGKTTLAHHLAGTRARVLVVAVWRKTLRDHGLDDQGPPPRRWSGKWGYIWTDDKEGARIIERTRNAAIVFDDCRAYFGSMPDDGLRRLLMGARHVGNDVYALFHGFTDVPPAFFKFTNYFVVFSTTDNIDTRKKDILEFSEIEKAQARANALAKKNRYAWIWLPNGEQE